MSDNHVGKENKSNPVWSGGDASVPAAPDNLSAERPSLGERHRPARAKEQQAWTQ